MLRQNNHQNDRFRNDDYKMSKNRSFIERKKLHLSGDNDRHILCGIRWPRSLTLTLAEKIVCRIRAVNYALRRQTLSHNQQYTPVCWYSKNAVKPF